MTIFFFALRGLIMQPPKYRSMSELVVRAGVPIASNGKTTQPTQAHAEDKKPDTRGNSLVVRNSVNFNTTHPYTPVKQPTNNALLKPNNTGQFNSAGQAISNKDLKKVTDSQKQAQAEGGGNKELPKPGEVNPQGKPINPSSGEFVTLAKPILTSGSTVEAETVDVYKGTIDSPQNKIKTVLSDVLSVINKGFVKTLSDNLGVLGKKFDPLLTKANKSGVMKALEAFKGDILKGVPLTKEGVSKVLMDNIGWDGRKFDLSDIKGSFKAMKEDLVKGVVETFDNGTGLYTLYENTRMILKGDYSSAEALFKIAENITGNEKLGSFLNMTEQFKVFGAIAKTLVNFGAIPKLNKLIDKIKGKKNQDKVLMETLAEGMTSGRLDYYEYLLSKFGGAKLLTLYPNILIDIVSNFVADLDEQGQVLKDQYTRFLKLLSDIDPNWDTLGIINGILAYNMQIFHYFGDHARLAIFHEGKRERIRALLVSETTIASYHLPQEAQKRFPYYPIIRGDAKRITAYRDAIQYERNRKGSSRLRFI